MDKLQEPISLCAVFIALITLSSCDSVVTVTEDEAVQLEFPYACESNEVTIQSANRLPFYNSEEPQYLILPAYQLQRFSVTDTNCSVQVKINPVKRSDEATYICQAYIDGAMQSVLTRIRLNVNYPPGNLYCTFRITDDAVGDWVPLQCTAPVGSLPGEIYCYQDSERVPSRSKLVETGETLKQTIWARKEYPVFCCSAIFDRPKDVCECKDFVWDPMGNISQTNTIIDPCPATTLGLFAILSQNPEREVEDNSQLPESVESLNLTNTNKNKSIVINTSALWGCVTAVLVIILIIIIIRLYVVEKTNKQLIQFQSANTNQQMKNMEENKPSESPEKKRFLHCRVHRHSE